MAQESNNVKGASKEQKRIEKEKEKAVKQAQSAVAKGMKKENWMEYMDVIIDENITTEKGGTQMITALELEGIKCDVIQQAIPNTICFTRTEMSSDDNGVINKSKIAEDVFLLVEQADDFGTRIQQETLISYIRQVASTCQANVTLFAIGHDKLMKSKRAGAIKRLEWEKGVLELQLDLNVTTYCMVDMTQLVDYVRMFCKALGERPHKLKHNKDLFIEASKQSLFVDVAGNGYLQVFIAQLQDIRSVNEAIASAVAQQYPSPLILSNFIADSNDSEAAVQTLADIPVRRGVGSLASVRRVGPEAARRIVAFYGTTNPDLKIE